MNIGDKVIRNPRYTGKQWCLCQGYRNCWCLKDGEWEIVSTVQALCQSGVMVVAEQNGKKLPSVDSQYFIGKKEIV